MVKEKTYCVGIYSAFSHGKYGKEHFTSWQLTGTSKAQVKDFAFEVIAGTTWYEMFASVARQPFKTVENYIEAHYMPWDATRVPGGCRNMIGEKYARERFSIRVEIDE